jgi:glycosyltransferase involved in cell wall biosynthesis
MRVVHVVTHAGYGGAARAAARIAAAQRGKGLEASILAASNPNQESHVTPWFDGPLRRWQVKAMMAKEVLPVWRATGHWKRSFQFSRCATGLPLHTHPEVKKADVLHLHWFQHGFLSMRGLELLATLKKPIVWTLHDMWAFTGGCHYNGDCERYLSGCGKCPILKGDSEADLSAKHFVLKQTFYKSFKGSLQFVAPSSWLQALAKHSPLTSDFKCTTIPYPIDTLAFRPHPQAALRQKWGLTEQGPLVLFAAFAIQDPRKGAHLLGPALTQLKERWPGMQLVTVGKDSLTLPNIPVHEMGYMANMADMAALYAACDATIVPSLQDNLPNVVLESLACGTPVAAFNIGGLPDMVIDGQTGFLAQDTTPTALAQALEAVLTHAHALRPQARAFAEAAFSEQAVASAYLRLYQTALPA